MKGVWDRIDETVQRFYAPWTDIPCHSLMVSGAQQALYTVIEKLSQEDLARVMRGQRPRNQPLIDWLYAEVNGMLQSDDGRVKAKTAS